MGVWFKRQSISNGPNCCIIHYISLIDFEQMMFTQILYEIVTVNKHLMNQDIWQQI